MRPSQIETVIDLPAGASPERNLWAAVLTQALADRHDYRKRLKKLDRENDKQDAIKKAGTRARRKQMLKRLLREIDIYLFEAAPFDYIGSFEGICGTLGLDPGRVRIAIRNGGNTNE